VSIRRVAGVKKVLVFGAFDFLHLGHLYFFQQAKKFGDFLVVVVGRDCNVLRAKKRACFFDEKERLELVSSLKIVDEAVLGSEKDVYAVIAKEKPSSVVLGYDQQADEKELRARLDSFGLEKTKIIRLKKAFKPHRHKSSKFKKKF